MFVSLLFAAALMAETPKDAPAQTAAAATATAPAKTSKVDNKDEIVCKNEAVVGTKMPKRTCYNKAQLAQKAADDRANLEHMQNQNSITHP